MNAATDASNVSAASATRAKFRLSRMAEAQLVPLLEVPVVHPRSVPPAVILTAWPARHRGRAGPYGRPRIISLWTTS